MTRNAHTATPDVTLGEQTLKAVLTGFLVASGLIVGGGWALTVVTAPTVRGEYYTPTLAATLLALVYTGVAIAAGAYVAARVNDSSATTSGFVVAQAFFGFGLIREFWSNGSSWYGVAAILLVIPCALIGRLLAQNGDRTRMARAG